MKKKLLYLGLISGSILFTACSEDSKTTEKTAVLGVQHVQENAEMSQIQTASEQSTSSRTEETTESRQTTSTTERASTIKDESSSVTEQVSSATKESDKKEDIETKRLNENNMKVGIIYMMKKGETIKKVSSEPKLRLETDIKTGETTATLLEGEAKILKSKSLF